MTKKLKIAFVSAFPPGKQSLNEYGYHLGRALAADDQVEHLVVLADKTDEPVQELDLGDKLTVKRVWDFNMVGTMTTLLGNLRKEKYDGVIFNVQTASFGDRELPAALGLMTPAFARMTGNYSGVIAHNIIAGIDLDETILKGQRMRQAIVKLGGSIVSRAMCSASYLTVTLPSYETILKEKYPRADITLVPHGTFDTEVRDLKSFSDRPKRIITMGKFGTYKRLETMLDAFVILRNNEAFADYELVIGGTDHPNTPGYVSDLARKWADDDAVKFHGYVAEDDVPSFFSEARLSVFDYNATTGSSGVLHQSASFGTVPVFPNIGDFVDVSAAEGIHGFHFTPGSAESMAKAMHDALIDPDASDELSASNKTASAEMPISKVAEFHIDKIRNHKESR